MTDRTDDPTARKELASSLREVLRSEQNREYARAFCRAVLVNFRTGLMVVPTKRDGKWFPRRGKIHE